MPRTAVVFYRERPGDVPVLDWLRELRRKNAPAYQKCVAGLERLALLGHELRRPLADLLRDEIYELRIRKGRVNYRILYFFYGRGLAVLGHAITKEDTVPDAEIERCIRRKIAFEAAPQQHTYAEGE
jgi:phage-related protein